MYRKQFGEYAYRCQDVKGYYYFVNFTFCKQEPPRPESLGAEATPEALYDEFPDNKPP